ncbi:hypothetical protein Pelo_8374 [Pelomyxa schiedti]|nr:hypothetical protein Pelo_8374 [Pelomyxa schiedti]
MASIAELLWDGFDKTVAKVDLNMRTMKEYFDFWNKRARVERDYGKELLELCKTHPGGKTPAVEKMEKTMREALITVSDSGQRIALKHTDISARITNEIVKPIEACIKQSDLDKKRIFTDGTRKIKIYMDTVAAVTKAHEVYIKASKDSEVAKDQYFRAEAEIKATPEPKKTKLVQGLPKFLQKRSQCIEKASQMEVAYKTSITASNEAQKKLYMEEMPVVLADLQKVIQYQFACMEQSAKTFLAMQKDFPPEHTAANDTMNTVVNDLSWSADLQEFIEATRNPTATGPTPLEFAPFEGKTSDALPSESVTAPPTTTVVAPTTPTTTTMAPTPIITPTLVLAPTPIVTPTPTVNSTPTVTPTPVSNSTPETTPEATPTAAATTTADSSSSSTTSDSTTTSTSQSTTTEPTTVTPVSTAPKVTAASSGLFDNPEELFGGTPKKDHDLVDTLFS